ncbi:zinc finger protein 821 [Trichomycterus rosablanca]|uniref:zinc finger protein 821 n=1 Tax=Trichomycterus rosablanca TaxID=2290929 RepID=UPI002F351124
MSRRKQTNPFKVNWPFHTTGFSGPQTVLEMEAKDDFAEDPACHSSNCQDLDEQDDITDDSDSDLDKEDSSNSSADDSMACDKSSQCLVFNGEMKQESEFDSDMGNNYVCPLCNLEFSGTEQLIAHVYQHTSTVGDSRSYVCPVCGRALSSPGSLGRHLLIHSDDRLSNCAVCGAHFNNTNNINREKLQEFLTHSDMECPSQDQACSVAQSISDNQMSIQRVNHGSSPGASLPPLPENLVSSGPSYPDPLNPLPDLLNPMPVYPADVLLVCNNCTAFQQLAGTQSSSMGKWAMRRRNEPSEVRVQRLERERVAKKTKRDRESPGEREMRRLRDREAKRIQRLQETQEQRARRLQRDREAMRLKRATETPERRQARLVREREAKRLKRRLEKIEPELRAQIEHDPAAVAALSSDVNMFPFPYTMPVSSVDNGLFMKLP